MARNMKKLTWINSWAKGNKQKKYNIEIRLGRISVVELKLCLCNERTCSRFKIMLFNFGLEF